MCKLERVPVLFGWTRLPSTTLTHSSSAGFVGILVLRIFFLLYTGAVLVCSWMVYPEAKGEWLVWLTNWGQIAVTVYFLFAAVNTIASRHDDPRPLSECHGVLRAGYILFELAFSWNLLVALMYWFTVYPYQPGVAHIEMIIKIHVHFVNIVWLVVEAMTNSIDFVPAHLIVILGLLYLYAIFNASYTATSYEMFAVLRWQTFGSVGVLIAITFFLVVSFYIGTSLNKLRSIVVDRYSLPPPPQPRLAFNSHNAHLSGAGSGSDTGRSRSRFHQQQQQQQHSDEEQTAFLKHRA
mmetsp:Transcript_25236/g.49648  ORF Transcript_25236/g.49648 Transcript_25236/m.49648 type:complete len:294 (-) Transcript_25236:96-977(-)